MPQSARLEQGPYPTGRRVTEVDANPAHDVRHANKVRSAPKVEGKRFDFVTFGR
jgi:hypothetical protein